MCPSYFFFKRHNDQDNLEKEEFIVAYNFRWWGHDYYGGDYIGAGRWHGSGAGAESFHPDQETQGQKGS